MLRRRWLTALCLAAAFSWSCGRSAPREAERSRAVFTDVTGLVVELNRMRSDPAGYAAKMEGRRSFYSGKLLRMPGQIAIRTEEGVAALDEAVAALRRMDPLPSAAASQSLAHAARDHVQDIGPKGLLAHEGSDGSSPRDRMSRYAGNLRASAEVISFGPAEPASVLIDLLVDDGVPGRGHRRILTDPKYRVAGAACGPHSTYRTVCVIDLADGGQ